MHRRGFLKRLGLAVAGSTVAYSFPSIIVPQNNIKVVDDIATISSITKQELWPGLIEDLWFKESPLLSYLRHTKLNELEGI